MSLSHREVDQLITVASWRWVRWSWRWMEFLWGAVSTGTPHASSLRPSRPKRGTMWTSWWPSSMWRYSWVEEESGRWQGQHQEKEESRRTTWGHGIQGSIYSNGTTLLDGHQQTNWSLSPSPLPLKPQLWVWTHGAQIYKVYLLLWTSFRILLNVLPPHCETLCTKTESSETYTFCLFSQC